MIVLLRSSFHAGRREHLGRTGRAGAADGLRILKAGQVDKELDGSIGHLESARFSEAVTSERTAIRGLEACSKKSRGWKA